ncbi:hypothetical protein [Ulvibacterium marinum]|uniref:hypothetical protein n=1 Tax=Ulvibacterium marinum TaxID=2419782 RepID=UPI002493EE82|nr:hypothetical protein [Ulvibacterium marinum]
MKHRDSLKFAYRQLAVSFLLTGDNKKAIAYFQLFIDDEETHSEYHQKYIKALIKDGRHEEAELWSKKNKN